MMRNIRGEEDDAKEAEMKIAEDGEFRKWKKQREKIDQLDEMIEVMIEEMMNHI